MPQFVEFDEVHEVGVEYLYAQERFVMRDRLLIRVCRVTRSLFGPSMSRRIHVPKSQLVYVSMKKLLHMSDSSHLKLRS